MDYTADNIRHWHVRGNKWKDIGYHFIVRKDGTIEKGRADDIIGAHVRGHNSGSLGIVWVGRWHFNEAQKWAVLYLYHYIRIKYGINWGDWYGHYEFTDKKTCPNLEMEDIRAWLESTGDMFLPSNGL
jgi:hypothetical protein